MSFNENEDENEKRLSLELAGAGWKELTRTLKVPPPTMWKREGLSRDAGAFFIFFRRK